ncbi:hypothetical protein [Paenibacillus mangrovi]|nr:hypothetical protein [Paenibacillus mangrovi]
MDLLVAVVVVIGLFGIIGNQYSALRRMERMQKTLEEIRDELRAK